MVFRTCQIHVLFSKRLNDRRSTSQRDRWERHHGFDCLNRAGGSWQWHARSKSHLPLNRYVATSPNGPNAKHRKIAAAATTNCIPKPYQETLSLQRRCLPSLLPSAPQHPQSGPDSVTGTVQLFDSPIMDFTNINVRVSLICCGSST